MPYVRLLDAAGGSVRTFEKIDRTYIPVSSSTPGVEALLCKVPVLSAVLGSVAGLPAVEACLCHFSVMVKGISQVFPGGPPVVKAALGYDITKEELGDERTHPYAILRGGAKMICATYRTRMPWITFVIRQLYGCRRAMPRPPRWHVQAGSLPFGQLGLDAH